MVVLGVQYAQMFITKIEDLTQQHGISVDADWGWVVASCVPERDKKFPTAVAVFQGPRGRIHLVAFNARGGIPAPYVDSALYRMLYCSELGDCGLNPQEEKPHEE